MVGPLNPSATMINIPSVKTLLLIKFCTNPITSARLRASYRPVLNSAYVLPFYILMNILEYILPIVSIILDNFHKYKFIMKKY